VPQATTATVSPPPGTPAAELAWARRVDAFAAALLPDLRRLERLTGGGGKRGAVGARLDPRIFEPGPTRSRFETTMTALAACGVTLDAYVSEPPTARMGGVRATLAHACTALEAVPTLLRADVLRATSQAGVDRSVLQEASGRADEGVRSIVDGLSTMRRLLAASP
jgi:hypothetical protein